MKTEDVLEAQRRCELINARVEKLFVGLLHEQSSSSQLYELFKRDIKALEYSQYTGGRQQETLPGICTQQQKVAEAPVFETSPKTSAVMLTAEVLDTKEEVVPTNGLSLKGALDIYLNDKRGSRSEGDAVWKRFRLERERVVKLLVDAIGDKDVTELSRQDARSFREKLIEQEKAPATINKYIANCHAILALAYRECEIHRNNPFARLKVKASFSEEDARRSFTGQELKVLLRELGLRSTSDELRDIFHILLDTGARLGEVVGLQLKDVDLRGDVPILQIRPNKFRDLKNQGSRRVVPLIGYALQGGLSVTARRYAAGVEAPLFPNYAGQSGNTKASARLMKFLRNRVGFKDPNVCVHSLRHTMKDRLRNVGVPKDVRNAIQGHSSSDVGENYGSGFSIKYLEQSLKKVCIS
ncbi:hypothetical protein GCM10009077_23120 [Roseibium denhamense]|nr:tyrosine-type recombinase/integrase [Roseibium denhamense]